MTQPPALKAALKRGALLAAANWPLVVVQFIAESTLKLLLAVPVVGGIFLVVLLLGADAGEVIAGDIREIVGTVFIALREHPAALVAFCAAFLLVALGGYALTFVVKAGTVAILAEAEYVAGLIERPPLRLDALRRANLTNIEPFLAGCRRLWWRYVKLGGCLLLVYTGTAVAYVAPVVGGYAILGNFSVLLGWSIAAVMGFCVLVVWLAIIDVLYLMTQMVIAVEDVGVRAGVVGVVRFIRTSLREVAGIFGIVFMMVVLAMIASILATAGLGLIAFVPLAGLAVVPLQVAAWLLRGFVFEYLGLTALGAYLTQYRYFARGGSAASVGDIDRIPGKRLA